MSDLSGGSSKGSASAGPNNWGVSPFDMSAVMDATGSNTQAVENRYQQLGLGGSTMEGQDVQGAQDMGQAMLGQLQTQNVGNANLNPALQPNPNSGSLSGLASGLGSLIGGGGGSGSGSSTGV